MSRQSWDEYWLGLLEKIGSRATCDRGRSGALLVDQDQQIISTGYVGAARGLPHCDEVGHLMRKVVYEDGTTHEHCVSGDTLVLKFQEKHYNSKHRTAKKIYELWSSKKTKRFVDKMLIRCVSESGLIVPGRILDVWKTGVTPVFEIKTKLGRSVKVSDNHRLLTESGWKELRDIKTGDKIALNGELLCESESWLRSKYVDEGRTQVDIARLAGCSRSRIKRRLDSFGIERREFKLGGWNKGFQRSENHLYKGREVKLPSSARERSRKYGLKDKCEICGSPKKLHVHHWDEDVRNDLDENLATLCVPCHALAHSPRAKREQIVFDLVTSITPCGEEELYDLTTTEGNFVGDGIVLHNCKRTGHAERNAITQAARKGSSTKGSTLYCTMEPCIDCANDIINAGVVRVVALHRYHGAKVTREWFAQVGIALKVVSDDQIKYDPEIKDAQDTSDKA